MQQPAAKEHPVSRKKHSRKPARTNLIVLAQLSNLIPGHLVPKLARQCGVDAKARSFSPWSHVVAHCMDWARHRRRKAAAKLHLRLNLQSFLPAFTLVDTAAHNDNKRAREVCAGLQEGEIAVFDKAYVDFKHLVDLAKRGAYGAEPGRVSFANNCLLARRLSESGVRFVQLYEKGWDSHGEIAKQHTERCRAVDRPIAALIADLKQRGLLDETLLIWGGEFGRTPMAQGDGSGYGRDHHPHGFTVWMAGGGIRPGIVHGATDEFGYFAEQDKVHVHDLNATILHCPGMDHEQFTYRHQGRDFRLTDVHGQGGHNLLA